MQPNCNKQHFPVNKKTNYIVKCSPDWAIAHMVRTILSFIVYKNTKELYIEIKKQWYKLKLLVNATFDRKHILLPK